MNMMIDTRLFTDEQAAEIQKLFSIGMDDEARQLMLDILDQNESPLLAQSGKPEV